MTPSKTPPKTLARTAGLLYLAVVVCTGFAVLYVQSRIVDPGDAAATAANIRASTTLFRIGFLSSLVGYTCWLLTAMALYLLLKHVHQLVAAAMVTFVAVGTAISVLNLLNQDTALTIATGADYTRTFGEAGADALTLLFTSRQNNGFFVASIFFALWLAPLGYLVIRSGYFPKVLGVLLIIGCIGDLADVFLHFLGSDLGRTIGSFLNTVGGIAELLFVGWLLVRAVRAATPEAPVPAPTRG